MTGQPVRSLADIAVSWIPVGMILGNFVLG